MSATRPGVPIRLARPEDAASGAPLLRLSMEPFADFYFGGHARLSTDEILRELFRTRGHRFSHRWSVLCDADEKAAGLLLAIPGSRVGLLSAGLALRLLVILGPAAFLRLALRLIDYAGLREASAGEYYIAQLAVLPEARRRGLATVLMEHAEQEARRSGLLRCSLFVDSENHAALRLYERLGYGVVEAQASRYPGFEVPHRTYLRMVKPLSARP